MKKQAQIPHLVLGVIFLFYILVIFGIRGSVSFIKFPLCPLEVVQGSDSFYDGYRLQSTDLTMEQRMFEL